MGRSQIAAALLSDLAGTSVEVRSAGSLPGSEVHPLVVEALEERGIDLAGAFPKPLTDDVVRAADGIPGPGSESRVDYRSSIRALCPLERVSRPSRVTSGHSIASARAT